MTQICSHPRGLTSHFVLQTKGELPQDRKEKHEAAQAAFQKLLSNTTLFAVGIISNFFLGLSAILKMNVM